MMMKGRRISMAGELKLGLWVYCTCIAGGIVWIEIGCFVFNWVVGTRGIEKQI